MRFGVPLSDSETESEDEDDTLNNLQPQKRSNHIKTPDRSHRQQPSASSSTSNHSNHFLSTPTRNLIKSPPLSRSLNSSAPGSARKIQKLKQPSGPYSVGLPVPKSETTPSPFAVVPNKIKSSSPGFPIVRSSLRIRLDEHNSFSSDEDEKSQENNEENDPLDSEEEQWPIRRSQSERVPNALDPSCRPHVLPDDDPLLIWEQQERRSTYQLSMQNASVRRQHFEGIHVRTLAQANKSSEQHYKQKVNELSEVLARIGLDQEKEMRILADGFEKRERERARMFEALISEAEKLEQEQILRQNRLRQEEAARQAEQERQEALKKQQLEELKLKEARLAEERERELKDQLERQKEEEEKLKLLESKSSSIQSAHKNYEKWFSTIQEIKSTVLPKVSSSESSKTICRQAKRKITSKVGQLTNGSRQIEKVIMEIGDALKESQRHSQEVYLWACNHLSKAVIKQAETEVTAKLSAVYPLARLVVGLILVGYSQLGDLLMARLVKKCYFVAAYRPIIKEGQSEADYRKQLGYQAENSSQEETRIQYNNRMAGIVALFAAIQQTDPYDVVPSLKGDVGLERIQRIPKELRLDSSWSWISTMLKVPMIGLTPTPRVLSCFLEVSGGRLYEVYGIQFLKLIRTILANGIENPHESLKFNWADPDCKPSIFQLQALLEDFLQKKTYLAHQNQYEEDPTGRFYTLTND